MKNQTTKMKDLNKRIENTKNIYEMSRTLDQAFEEGKVEQVLTYIQSSPRITKLFSNNLTRYTRQLQERGEHTELIEGLPTQKTNIEYSFF